MGLWSEIYASLLRIERWSCLILIVVYKDGKWKTKSRTICMNSQDLLYECVSLCFHSEDKTDHFICEFIDDII